MQVTVGGVVATDLDDAVVMHVLNIYPEEELLRREVFSRAFAEGKISFKDLTEECEKLLLPWQLFFLSNSNLVKQIAHIEKQRKIKVSPKLFAKRRGQGEETSRRIVDRLIRQQNFLVSQVGMKENALCGLLKGLSVAKAAESFLTHFELDLNSFWKYSRRASALEFLISKVESKFVNVSRGVSSHKLLPNHMVVPGKVYKNTSGFAIRDGRVPFVFLPSEINPDEVESRQIYTLVYLLAAIGLDEYHYLIGESLRAKAVKQSRVEERLHSITTEILIPRDLTASLDAIELTPKRCDELAEKLKVSRLALVVTLFRRKVISKEQMETLKPPKFEPGSVKRNARTPKLLNAVAKFCGTKSFEAINEGIRSRTLTSVEAQYLIWGSINKMKFKEFKGELGI